MSIKSKINIISASYPFGDTETFLHNEVLFLSKYFNIELFPIIKNPIKNSLVKDLPTNITYNDPFLNRSYANRIFKGLFNLSPIWPHLKDLVAIFSSPNNLKVKLSAWFVSFLTFRIMFASKKIKQIKKDTGSTLYVYWGNMPLYFYQDIAENIFMRIHSSEVDLERNLGYIPLLNYNIIHHQSICYLPISLKAEENLLKIKKVNSILNRLGVYDHGLNPDTTTSNFIRVVSCSFLIALKRVHLIVEALKQIKAVRVEWVHFGGGPLMSDIQKLNKELPENIKVVMKGWVDNKEVLAYYGSNPVDLFMNVSNTEGVPVSIMEALSFGIPCFATNVGGSGEIVNSSNGSLVAKDFETNVLTKFIENIKVNSKENDYRANARATWAKLCDANNNYSKLVDIFSAKNNIA